MKSKKNKIGEKKERKAAASEKKKKLCIRVRLSALSPHQFVLSLAAPWLVLAEADAKAEADADHSVSHGLPHVPHVPHAPHPVPHGHPGPYAPPPPPYGHPPHGPPPHGHDPHYAGPPACAKHLPNKPYKYCLEDPEYPTYEIQQAIEYNYDAVQQLYKDVLANTENSVDRLKDIIQETYLCPSETKYIQPLRAVNVHGKWRIIVNHVKAHYELLSQVKDEINLFSLCPIHTFYFFYLISDRPR